MSSSEENAGGECRAAISAAYSHSSRPRAHLVERLLRAVGQKGFCCLLRENHNGVVDLNVELVANPHKLGLALRDNSLFVAHDLVSVERGKDAEV